MYPLFLVESPAKETSLVDLLGQKIDTLIISTTPVEIVPSPRRKKEKDDRPFLFKPSPEAEKIISEILSSLDREIYLAFDNDQRGEHWSWMISELITAVTEGRKTPKRIRIRSLTEKTIEMSLKKPVDNHYENGFAFQVNTMFDHLLVRHLKRLTGSARRPDGLSLNFPTLTVLFLLAEREDEIRNFSPLNKRKIMVRFSGTEAEFDARLKTAANITKDGLFRRKDEIKKALSLLEGKNFSIKSISRVPKKTHPPLPFNTLSLVQDSYLQLKLDPQRTLELAKELFYGVKIAGQNRGLISFFLTESTDLPDGMANALREYLSKFQGENSLGLSKTANESEGLPIIPLLPEITPEQVASTLSQDAADLYVLIRNRALASQMKEASGEKIEVVIEAGDECTLSVDGFFVTEKGHLDLYQSMTEKDLAADSYLAHLQEGEVLNIVKTSVELTSGVPPEYYTLETIFFDLAEMGISMDFNMAAILQDMLRMDYLKIAPQGTLHPSKKCGILVEDMDSAFPTMPNTTLSAYFVQTVDEVISGRKDLWDALSQLDQTLNMQGKAKEKTRVSAHNAENIRIHQEPQPVIDDKQKLYSNIHGEKEREDRSFIQEIPWKDHRIDMVETFEFRSMKTRPYKKGPSSGQSKIHGKTEIPDIPGSQSPAERAAPPIDTSIETAVTNATQEEINAQRKEQPLEREIAQKTEVITKDRVPEIVINEKIAESKAEEIIESSEEMSAKEEPTGKIEEEELLAKPPGIEETTKEEPPWEKTEKKEDKLSASEEIGQETKEDGIGEKYCPDCGRRMRQGEDIYGKYWQCSGFPECRHTESIDKHAMKMVCPVCHVGEVITERTQIGKKFYVCSEKECEFITWYRPHTIKCPECDNPFLVEKQNARGITSLWCPRAGCQYKVSPSEESTPVISLVGSHSKKTRKVRKVLVKAKGDRDKPKRKVVRKVVRAKAR